MLPQSTSSVAAALGFTIRATSNQGGNLGTVALDKGPTFEFPLQHSGWTCPELHQSRLRLYKIHSTAGAAMEAAGSGDCVEAHFCRDAHRGGFWAQKIHNIPTLLFRPTGHPPPW